jgi:hypothetical protein
MFTNTPGLKRGAESVQLVTGSSIADRIEAQGVFAADMPDTHQQDCYNSATTYDAR